MVVTTRGVDPDLAVRAGLMPRDTLRAGLIPRAELGVPDLLEALRARYLAIFICSKWRTRSMAPGLHWMTASMSSLGMLYPIFRSTLLFNVFQLYIFCCVELAGG